MMMLLESPASAQPAAAEAEESFAVRVLVVEGHALVAEGLVAVLRAAGCDAHPCTPQDPAQVLALARELTPDVVLVDLGLSRPGGQEPCLVGALRALGVEVVALTAGTDPLILAAAVEAGANGVVSKMGPVGELAETVRRAARHERLLSAHECIALIDLLRRERAETRARLAPFARLTPREAAVLERLMEGESAELVSTASYVSLATVRTQIRAILTKLGVSSQLAAVAMAYRAGWTPAARPAA